MGTLARPHGPLHYEVTDVVAPWQGEPETILFLHPDASPFIPLPMALELHARAPHSELRIFPGARHALAHTHARACAAAMREFLARRVSPAA
jgi:pimeloyl-ACP methyl ester carboxylesterase